MPAGRTFVRMLLAFYRLSRFVSLSLQCLIIVTTFSRAGAQGRIVLSEVMFNPSGNENFDEFIEIYNTGDSAADLSGWIIGDGTASDELIDGGWGLTLAPAQYGIILDNGYFENSTEYDSLIPPEALILTIDGATFGLNGLLNSAPETVTLFAPDSSVIAEYTYSVDNGQGISDEKIDLNAGDEPFNWSNSLIQKGTPGFKNSVTPAEIDLAVSRIQIEPELPSFGQPFVLTAIIENRGTETASGFTVTYFVDSDNDSAYSTGEQLLSKFRNSTALEPGDSASFSTEMTDFQWSSIRIGAVVSIEGDEKPSNDIYFIEISLRFETEMLVINEIMYDPFIEGEAFSPQSEYIEIFNTADETVFLDGWSFSDADSSRRYIILNSGAIILPGDYFVFAADSNHLLFFGEDSLRTFIAGSGFPRLNNDGDEVFLFSPAVETVDRVEYSPGFGGNRGVSVERIDPYSNSNSPDNWLNSVELLGGTPGKENSVSKPIVTNDLKINLDPNPFSPDGDGFDDLLEIGYKLPSRSVILDIYIFDSIGRRVRRLVSSASAGSEGIYTWDGLDGRQRKLPIGIYIIYLEATAPLEGKVYSGKAVAVLARKF